MNIYTAPGCKVKYTGKGGYEFERNEADKILDRNKEYTVESVTVGGWTSYVYLEEVQGKFNTVMFENIGEIDEVDPSEYNTYEVWN